MANLYQLHVKTSRDVNLTSRIYTKAMNFLFVFLRKVSSCFYQQSVNSNFICDLVISISLLRKDQTTMAVEMKFVLVFALLAYTKFSLGNETGASQVS